MAINPNPEGVEQCIIVGSGCAGLTAGIYAVRANRSPLIIGGLVPGGQLMLTSDVENFPGFQKAIDGPSLMENMRAQCLRLGVRFINDQVEKVDFKSSPFRLWLSDQRELKAQSVIVATGANAQWLNLPSEKRLRGKGISACAVCDGFFFKGKDLCVVGGGDTAMEEATFLTNFASSVTVVHRRDKLRASQAMQDKAKKNPKIKFIWNSVVTEVLGEEVVTGVRLQNILTQKTQDLVFGGLFIAIGHEPATAAFAGAIDRDEKGYIKVKPGSWVQTSREGVFAAGDCVDHRYRQAVTAAGFGCMAAMEVNWYLENKGI